MSDPATDSKPINIVVFASGRGTGFRAICKAVKQKELHAHIVALICNRPKAPVTSIAREYGIPVIEESHQGLSRFEHERRILNKLKDLHAQWLVLAGYMRLFTAEFIAHFHDEKRGVSQIVNIHPSLLPSFPGKEGYAQALRYGVKVTGVTIHLVDAGLDDGPLVAQRAVEVLDNDTLESLTKRGLAVEHKLYPETLNRLFTQKWTVHSGALEGGRDRVVFLGKGKTS